MMVAEKAADLIRRARRCRPEPTSFYRHRLVDRLIGQDGAVSDFAATFDLDAAGYAGGRPGYPAVLFDVLERRCGLGRGPVGGRDRARHRTGDGRAAAAWRPGACGRTGRCARRAPRGGHGGGTLIVTVSSFEEADMAEGTADLVVAATSFHWVDTEIGMKKVRRALRGKVDRSLVEPLVRPGRPRCVQPGTRSGLRRVRQPREPRSRRPEPGGALAAADAPRGLRGCDS